MARLLAIFICLLAAMAGLGWGVVQQRKLEFESRRHALVAAENERLRGLLAAAEKSSPAQLAQREEIEEAVAAIRGLRFLKPVDYNELSRAGIKKTIEGKLAQQYSDQEFANIGLGYMALGLLPANYPLKQKYIELLGEQVAAFYDQHEHKLFMFEDAKLSSAQNRVVLAHELAHALQDQHFGLRKLPLELKTNDDRAIAASALVEGDATLVMSEYMLRNLSWGAVRDSLGGLMMQNMDELQKAPRFLRESLIFPYLRGQEFCTALHARGGYEAISAAYKNPPSSSAQILHPEKYLATPREEPIAIEWSETTVMGERPLADNVLGEWGTRLLLAGYVDAKAAENAADGWRGDRYLVFDHGDALVWKSVWSSREEAWQFFRAMQTRYTQGFTQHPTGNAANLFSTETPRLIRMIVNDRHEVVLIDAGTAKWAEALVGQFASEVHEARIQ